MPVVGRADAVGWEALFNVSAGAVLIRLRGVANSVRLTYPPTGSTLVGAAVRTLATNARSALILAIFKAPLAVLREGLALVGAIKEAVPVMTANLARKMELAPPMATTVKPVTRPLWTAIAVASRWNAAILVAKTNPAGSPSVESP